MYVMVISKEDYTDRHKAETLDIELRELVEEKPIVDPKTPSDKIWSFPLSSWAYYHKLQQMEWIVSIGFELQIYRVDELGGMYWCGLLSSYLWSQLLITAGIFNIWLVRVFSISNESAPSPIDVWHKCRNCHKIRKSPILGHLTT
jgi:hypothetical protein